MRTSATKPYKGLFNSPTLPSPGRLHGTAGKLGGDMVAKIKIENVVASSDLGTEINLNAIAISLGLEKVEHEPEQFPGLVYRIDVPKVVVLLFGSGKLVCTGARKPQDVEQAVEKITEELKAAGLLR